jgi:hypothetical protein
MVLLDCEINAWPAKEVIASVPSIGLREHVEAAIATRLHAEGARGIKRYLSRGRGGLG